MCCPICQGKQYPPIRKLPPPIASYHANAHILSGSLRSPHNALNSPSYIANEFEKKKDVLCAWGVCLLPGFKYLNVGCLINLCNSSIHSS